MIFCPKMTKFGIFVHCRLIWCPVGRLVGGCGARAVSRKTPIYFILFRNISWKRTTTVKKYDTVYVIKMLLPITSNQWQIEYPVRGRVAKICYACNDHWWTSETLRWGHFKKMDYQCFSRNCGITVPQRLRTQLMHRIFAFATQHEVKAELMQKFQDMSSYLN